MKIIYEIQDDTGTLFRGDAMEIMYIWGTNWYNNEFFEKTYGHLNRNPEYILKQWQGRLRVVSIIDEANRGPGIHERLNYDEMLKSIDSKSFF